LKNSLQAIGIVTDENSVSYNRLVIFCFVFLLFSKNNADEKWQRFNVQISKARDGRRFIAGRARSSCSSPTNCKIVTTKNWTTTTATSAGNFWGTDYLFSRGKVLRLDPEYYRPSGPLSDEQPGVNELWFGSVSLKLPFSRAPVSTVPPFQLVGPSQ